jgi:hypothetical protein
MKINDIIDLREVSPNLIDTSYQTVPFEIMEQSVISANMDYKALYDKLFAKQNYTGAKKLLEIALKENDNFDKHI